MIKNKNFPPFNNIALYEVLYQETEIKRFFYFLEAWAEEIHIPWESIGLPQARKLILFKNGKRRLEKNNFDLLGFKKKDDVDTLSIELYGGVEEPGTHSSWKVYSVISFARKGKIVLSFPDELIHFNRDNIKELMQNILDFSNPRYAIAYQRDYDKGPGFYAAGCIGGWGEIDSKERERINCWDNAYSYKESVYRTGLLRDVYPFNVFIDTHLTQPVGKGTLESWINADPAHGRLEKITDKHWLWAIDPPHIPAAQEALQEAGLLLCYKV